MKTASTISSLIYLYDSSQVGLDGFKEQATEIIKKFNPELSYSEVDVRAKEVLIRLLSR